MRGMTAHFRFLIIVSRNSVRNIRNKRNLARSLYRSGKSSLVECAAARNSAGQNFRTLRHKLLELCDVLIINKFRPIGAKLANLFASALDRMRRSLNFISHDTLPPYYFVVLVRTGSRRCLPRRNPQRARECSGVRDCSARARNILRHSPRAALQAAARRNFRRYFRRLRPCRR